MGITVEERNAFRDQVQRLLADRSAEAEVRRTMETEAGFDRDLWRALAEMGAVGLIVAEAHGGTGAGPEALELVFEEVGAALLCGPLLASGVLAAGLLQALGDEEAKARLLPAISDGSLIGTVALTGPDGSWTEAGVAVSATEREGRWSLDGTASFVSFAHVADVVLTVARVDGVAQVFEVDPSARGVTISVLPTFDHTQRLAKIAFDGAQARRLTGVGPAWAAVEQALDLALVALAGEQAGAGRKVLAMTVDYAKTRIQFGRAIGSFQAIKHMAADLLLESESAVSAARAAAQALEAGTPDARAAVALAAFACAEAFSRITADAVQMHGGIAFTWAHPAHLYLRRARADAQLFGAPPYWRERYLQALGV